MTRLARAWGVLEPEQRLAAVAAVALLVTMFLPWYDLQSLNRKSGAIYSHSISAFGDVSFVEAAVFLVAAGVIALIFARAEHHDFHMPGSDGAVVMAAGCWAALLIFYRVFSRPDGHGYPVGIEWGFFLAFVAAGLLGYAGWRMRATSLPEAPLRRARGGGRGGRAQSHRRTAAEEDLTVVVPSSQRAKPSSPAPARPVQSSEQDTSVVERSPQPPPSTTPSPPTPQSNPARRRPRFPPPPSDQLSFEDPPPEQDRH